MFKFNLYYATVIDNTDSDKIGRVKVKILPEFDDIRDSDLPWAKPFFNIGMSVKEFNKRTPKKDSKVWVLADKYFEEIYYLSGVFIDGFFDYASVKDKVDGIDEASSTASPNLDFIKFDNENILFHNIVNGDIGILHTSGTYIIIDKNGDGYGSFSDTKIEIKTDGTYKIEGNGTIECKSSGQVDINGNLTVDT
jgi:hypothetical protein